MAEGIERVRYIGASDAHVIYRGHDDPRERLIVGAVYVVRHREVFDWHTQIELVGHEGWRFNSVSFERVH